MGLLVFYMPATGSVDMSLVLTMVVCFVVIFMPVRFRVYFGRLVQMIFRVVNKCVGMVVLASSAVDMPASACWLAKLGSNWAHICWRLLHTQLSFGRCYDSFGVHYAEAAFLSGKMSSGSACL